MNKEFVEFLIKERMKQLVKKGIDIRIEEEMMAFAKRYGSAWREEYVKAASKLSKMDVKHDRII